jgi:hypothetical protein
MSKKLLMGLAPLLAMVAFAVMPAVSQATPHFYKNGSKLAEGVKVPVIAWGNLELTAEGVPTTECQNAVGGYVENPKLGGAGVGATESFNAYNCKNAGCNAVGDFESVQARNGNGEHETSTTQGPFGNGNQVKWPSVLTEAVTGEIRTDSSNVSVLVGCREPSGELVTGLDVECFTDATHEQTPLDSNGTGIGNHPSKTTFDEKSGGLNCSGAFTGKTGKALKVMGYNEQEIIETKNP